MESLRQVIKDIKYQNDLPSKPIVTKEYIYHLQSEIDYLEDQLFNSNHSQEKKHRHHKHHNRESEDYIKKKEEEGNGVPNYDYHHQLIEAKDFTCKQLENNMNKLLSEKEEQTTKIKKLQQEIDELRKKKREKIDIDKGKLEKQFN